MEMVNLNEVLGKLAEHWDKRLLIDTTTRPYKAKVPAVAVQVELTAEQCFQEEVVRDALNEAFEALGEACNYSALIVYVYYDRTKAEFFLTFEVPRNGILPKPRLRTLEDIDMMGPGDLGYQGESYAIRLRELAREWISRLDAPGDSTHELFPFLGETDYKRVEMRKAVIRFIREFFDLYEVFV